MPDLVIKPGKADSTTETSKFFVQLLARFFVVNTVGWINDTLELTHDLSVAERAPYPLNHGLVVVETVSWLD